MLELHASLVIPCRSSSVIPDVSRNKSEETARVSGAVIQGCGSSRPAGVMSELSLLLFDRVAGPDLAVHIGGRHDLDARRHRGRLPIEDQRARLRSNSVRIVCGAFPIGVQLRAKRS